MACYCGVCAIRLYDATENYGGFQVNDFQGWYRHEGQVRIDDTCEKCADLLREAVTKVANEIVAKYQAQVDALAEAVAREESERIREQEERRKFEAAWHAYKRSEDRT